MFGSFIFEISLIQIFINENLRRNLRLFWYFFVFLRKNTFKKMDDKSLIEKYNEAEARIAEAKVCLARLEKKLNERKIELASKELQIEQLRLITRCKKESSPLPGAVVFDIDTIIESYKKQFPLHKPFIYWKSLINILSTFNQTELKKALKSHDISKYVKWQIQPPK